MPRQQTKVVVQVPQPGRNVPTTRSELQALIAQRSELRDQLQSLNQRRADLMGQSLITKGQLQADVLERLQQLDIRIAQIDRQLLQADAAISTAMGAGVMNQPAERPEPVVVVPPRLPRTTDLGIERLAVFNGVGFVLLGLVMWMMLRRRGHARSVDQSARLDQLQQAVDTIALEVERISEGQRFVAKVLNERLPSLVAGEAQPLSVSNKDRVPDTLKR